MLMYRFLHFGDLVTELLVSEILYKQMTNLFCLTQSNNRLKEKRKIVQTMQDAK